MNYIIIITKLLLVFPILFINAQEEERDYCSALQVPQCENREARDVIFLLDTSLSINRTELAIYGLPAIKHIICAFDASRLNRFGLITFNSRILQRIPLARYTRNEWESKINGLIAQVNNDPNFVSCCTPLAEAFEEARDMILNSPPSNNFKIVYTLSDGYPYQNDKNGRYDVRFMSEAVYTFIQVPASAQSLKNIGARLMVLGIQPNRTSAGSVNCNYFAGIPNPELTRGGNFRLQCITRGSRRTCREMKLPPFPIPSYPLVNNHFCVDSFEQLLEETVDSICLPPVPTQSPIPFPTFSPTLSPTFSPTNRPTNSPTLSPSVSPTFSPTNRPTNSPTLSPSVSPTFSPTFSPTLMPTNKPTNLPTFSPTNDPTAVPTTDPTISPTEAPLPPPQFDSLDLYFVVDMSDSMNDYSIFCNSVNKNPNFQANFKKSCLGVLLEFINSTALSLTKIGRSQPMGWQGDYPDSLDGVGLNTYVLGFSCSKSERVPITYELVSATTENQFQSQLKEAFANFNFGGRTCPSEAVDKAVRRIEKTKRGKRQFQALIFLSDGITSPRDRQKVIRSTQGFKHFGVNVFAVGLAIPKESTKFGLSLAEIRLQSQQLNAIVGNNKEALLSLSGTTAFESLSKIRSTIRRIIVEQVISSEDSEPYCGYATYTVCVEKSSCKWVKGICTLNF